LSEAAAVAAFITEFVVSIPFGTARYDLVLDDGERLHRVQVKTGQVKGEVIRFSTQSINAYARQDYVGAADYFAVWAQTLGKLYVLPVAICSRGFQSLRLSEARNGQSQGIKFAADYEFDGTLPSR
jgi:hypothetical protein